MGGLADLQAELEEIERQKESLERREKQLHKAMPARVRGVQPEDLDDCFSYRRDSEVDGAVRKRTAVHEDELLAESDLGQQVLRLRREREELLDVVWLATLSR
jgi:Flp pilus assembly protein TadD